MVKKTLGCKWSGFRLGYEIRRPRLPFCQEPLEIPTKTFRFCMVRFSNCWDCSLSHSKIQTIWNLDFLKVPTVFSNQTNFDHSNNGLVWNSEGNCSQENSNTKISLVLYSDLYLTLISKNTIKYGTEVQDLNTGKIQNSGDLKTGHIQILNDRQEVGLQIVLTTNRDLKSWCPFDK